ncbi:MAG: recombinase family protein [Alteraurantiacibacter sp.]
MSKVTRCAIYTRKSSDEGLDQSFNSLDAPREAGEAYVKSQAHEGWKAIPTLYDDGGYSGGSMERPALKLLLADIDAGLIDVVVVYKIDRLTRSLPDFARIVEKFDAREVSFVSVTQAFNTTSSMGRLTLNVLLSFAQFEREVTGERIRDKIAASKAKGMWMGGNVPLGYDIPAPGSRMLQVNEAEAATIRHIFARYLELGSVHALQRELAAQGIMSKQRTTGTGATYGGCPINRGALFHMLANPIYLGRIRHRHVVHDGEHEAIVSEELFDRVQNLLREQAPRRRVASERRFSKSPIAGKLFDENGEAMTPTFAKGKTGRFYRYYVSASLQQGGRPTDDGMVRRVSGPAIERVLAEIILAWVPRDPAPLDLPLAIRLKRDSLLIDLPGRLAADISGRLGDNETIVHMDRDAVRIRVPLAFPLRGGKRTIVGGSAQSTNPDPRLIAALRRANGMVDWQRGLPVVTVAPVSAHDRKIMRLAFLGPDLQRDILSGHQPPSLNLERLRWLEIPLCWKRQREALGWSSPTLR